MSTDDYGYSHRAATGRAPHAERLDPSLLADAAARVARSTKAMSDHYTRLDAALLISMVAAIALCLSIVSAANDASAQVPFVPNSLFTTPFGPAYADVVIKPDNFLKCFGGPVALCYYSGPGPTQANPTDLSCGLTADGKFANCRCIEVPIGLYFVDINAILNLDTYLETVKQCGQDGGGCRVPNSAPVCELINRKKLIPGAELISTFSLYLDANFPETYGLGQTNTTCQAQPYAGCMTAPCVRTGEIDPSTHLPIVQCSCPTFDGPYQVGQDDSGTCNLSTAPPSKGGGANRVWSAAFAPLPFVKTYPVSPTCFPDVPEASGGCPLLPRDVVPPPPSNVSCRQVCAEYRQSRSQGIEKGFTCDATLCTATGDNPGLVAKACIGLQNASISEILKLETEAECSCCASQICGCEPDAQTNEAIWLLNQEQRNLGIAPQCDLNGTLCGTPVFAGKVSNVGSAGKGSIDKMSGSALVPDLPLTVTIQSLLRDAEGEHVSGLPITLCRHPGSNGDSAVYDLVLDPSTGACRPRRASEGPVFRLTLDQEGETFSLKVSRADISTTVLRPGPQPCNFTTELQLNLPQAKRVVFLDVPWTGCGTTGLVTPPKR